LIFPGIFYKILIVTQILFLALIAFGGEGRLRWIDAVTLFEFWEWKGIRIAEIDQKGHRCFTNFHYGFLGTLDGG